MKFYFCQECHRRIKDGEVVLKVEEAETGKIVYLAHKECAKDDHMGTQDPSLGRTTLS